MVAAGRLAYTQGDDTAAMWLGAEAVAVARQANDKAVLGRALAALGQAQILPGHVEEAKANLNEALDLGRETSDVRSVENILGWMVQLESLTSPSAAKQSAEQCVALCRYSGNIRTLTLSLDWLASLEQVSGNYERAMSLFQEALSYTRQLGRIGSLPGRLGNVGGCLLGQGDYERALPYLEESLALAKTQKLYTAYILQTLADLHFAQEDYITARRLSEEAFCQTKEQGNDDVFIQQRTMLGRGNVALAQGDPSAALAHHRTALRVAVDPEGTLDCLEGIAASLAGLGEYEQAVILTASADRGRKELFIPLPPNRHSRHAQQTEMLREAVPGAVFERAWAEGESLSLTVAVNRALEVADRLQQVR